MARPGPRNFTRPVLLIRLSVPPLLSLPLPLPFPYLSFPFLSFADGSEVRPLMKARPICLTLPGPTVNRRPRPPLRVPEARARSGLPAAPCGLPPPTACLVCLRKRERGRRRRRRRLGGRSFASPGFFLSSDLISATACCFSFRCSCAAAVVPFTSLRIRWPSFVHSVFYVRPNSTFLSLVRRVV